ncbi:MAG: ABC transporter permease [Chloroflexi bacterium]|nr:ABC transporter permease [Chloroflexota bacterium]
MTGIRESQQAQTLHVQGRSEWYRAFVQLRKNKAAVISAFVLLAIILAAIFAPLLTTYDPTVQNLSERLQGPSPQHIFGTDRGGRDIFSRVLYGARVSLTVGLLAVVIGAAVGVTLGLASGYFGGLVDNVIMRVIEVIMAFPGILLAILIVAILGPGLFNVLLALSVYALPGMSRVARGNTLSLREQDFVTAARASGVPDAGIMFRHILPNALAPLIVVTTLRVASVILSASSLSFLGLGAQPPTPEWGAMISEGRFNLYEAPHIMFFPGMAILLTVLCLNFIGDAIRDAFDPRMRER